MSNAVQRVSYDDKETRTDEMHSTIEQWLGDLRDLTDEARATEEFQAWLDAQARFHDYSFRNTLLIKQQCPHASKVAGYRTWQEEFDRQVDGGESAIWIWAPIIADQCPDCGNSPNYRDHDDCDTAVPPAEWSEGVVGFRPVPVFDVSQTSGEPLPTLDTAAHGDGGELLDALVGSRDALDVDVTFVDSDEWGHGTAKGVCGTDGDANRIELRRQANTADLASVLVHEYAHAALHMDGSNESTSVAEVEAEAVAYVVGRCFGLDVDGAAFYLASWADEDTDVLEERCRRISSTAQRLISAVRSKRNESNQ